MVLAAPVHRLLESLFEGLSHLAASLLYCSAEDRGDC